MEDLLFGNKEHIDAWQECARAVVVFLFGLVTVRAVGRRIFGQWSTLDFIISVIAGSALGRVLTGGAPLFATLAACALLMGVHWALAHYAARHKLFATVLEGRAVTLAENGLLDEAEMLRHNITASDLAQALRQQGCETLGEAKRVTLEPSGTISVLPRT